LNATSNPVSNPDMKLEAGEVRKKGDEVRSFVQPMCEARPDLDKWRKTELIGWEILKSDLAHLEFRRPGKE
jgi:hypothetical protein